MERKLSSSNIITISLFIVPCILAWAWSIEVRFSEPHENTRKIIEVEKDVRDLELSIVKMDEKLDDKSASDNANFLLVLQHVSDLKVEIAKIEKNK